MKVKGQQQISKFLTELLPLPIFELLSGPIEVSSGSEFSLFAAKFSGERLGKLSVEGKAGEDSHSSAILFPQFVLHGGWATALILSNTGASTAAGRIDIFSSKGDPMPVTMNGVTASSFKYSVAPGRVHILWPGTVQQ